MNAAPHIESPAAGELYWFKLEFPDKRWNIQAMELAAPPQEGDSVDLGGDGHWTVCGRRSVRVRPSGKPDREFFVCVPAPSPAF